MTEPSVPLQPVASWPREVEPGQSYLITVDMVLSDPTANWPYDREEYPISCMVDSQSGSDLEIESLGVTTVVLHRFGGTYGPARFVLHVATTAALETEGELNLSLITAGGVPFRTIPLPVQVTLSTGNPPAANDARKIFREQLPYRLPPEDLAVPSEPDAAESPVKSLPPEIVTTGTNGISAFMRALEQGAEVQWSSKLLIVGEAAVGKTSVANVLCGLPYDPSEPQTHGIHLNTMLLPHPDVPKTKMELSVWDFGGQLEYRATQRFYLTDRSLFLLVWNARRGWRAGGQVEAWIQAISNAAPTSPIIIVATHCRDSVADLDETGLLRRYPKISAAVQVDCQDQLGFDELREQIARAAAALPLMGQRWPHAWSTAAARLASEPGRYITEHRSAELLSAAGVHDEVSRGALISALHDRGEILHFAHDPELRDIVVLRPAWVDMMITRVLDSQEVVDRGGVLTRTHRADLWHDVDDPGLAEMLTVMMERFDLAYRIEAIGHEDVAMVVERLPFFRPELPAAWEQVLELPGTRELRITFRLGSRQAGVPSWFIAREHRFSTGIVWARGVLLRHQGAAGDSWALLEDDDQAQPNLQLTVRGTAPHVFYSMLIEGFIGILAERYPGLSAKMSVPCICAGAAGPPCSHEYDYANSLRALNSGHMLQCHETFQMIDPGELLLGLRPYGRSSALAGIEAHLDGLNNQLSRVEHSQLRVLNTVRDLIDHRDSQGARCPSIFTVTKTGRTRFQLRLYCEFPEAPHPLPGGSGIYHFRRRPAWLLPYAPYLRILLNAVRLGLPLVMPATNGLFNDLLPTSSMTELEQASKFLEELLTTNNGVKRAQSDGRGAPPQVDFAQLREALVAIDPDFGGLHECELPESRGTVYLCLEHRIALQYPAQHTQHASEED